MTRRALSALAAVALLAAACSSDEAASGREPTSTPAPDATAGGSDGRLRGVTRHGVARAAGQAGIMAAAAGALAEAAAR